LLSQSTSFATSYPFLQIDLEYYKAAHPEPPQGLFLKLCVQAFLLIHLLFLLAIRLSEELLKLDKLISSLSSGDEKISILTELKLKLTTKIQQFLPSHLISFHRLPTTRLVCMEMHTINPPRSPQEQIIMHTPI
jgi:hypothetical protein